MKHFYLTTAIALLASPALAQITPDALVESWYKAFDRVQIDLTIGSQAFDGEVLVLNDVQLTSRNPLSNSLQSIGWMRLSPLPGGAVGIVLSSTENMGVTMTLPANPDTQITTRSRYDGLEITATGSPEKITYNLDADRFEFSQQLDTAPIVTKTAVIASDISGQYSLWEDTNGNVRSEGQLVAASMDIEWAKTVNLSGDPTDGDVIQIGNVSLINLSIPFEMTAPPEYSTAIYNPSQGFPDGVTMDMQVLVDEATLHINGGNVETDFTLDIGASDSEFAMNIGETNLRYLFDFSQLALISNSPTFPNQPMTLGIDQLLLDLSMPFRKEVSASPFALMAQLKSLVMAPAIWDIFDPNMEMARAAASVDLRLSGEATLLVDLFNPEEMNSLAGLPVQLHMLSLDRFDIRAENATLTAEGRVLIDNNMVTDPSGLPAITGIVDISLTGALAFLDRVGRLPNMDPMMAIGAKGALGMFASPTSEADSFTSRIEFSEGGGVSVNGQQVR